MCPRSATACKACARVRPRRSWPSLIARINERLANDNATGRVPEEIDGQCAELIVFLGRDRPRIPTYGPFTQEGHLDGVLISVGGKDETISIRLQNGAVTYSGCETTRPIAREMGKHLFEPVRIHGTGRWLRDAQGDWLLLGFRVARFDVLEGGSLREAGRRCGGAWQRLEEIDDPLAELADLRGDRDEMH